MYEVKWIKGSVDGRIGVIVPYNQKFNDELKAMVPSARFREDRSTDAWFFDEEAKEDVLHILEKFYVNAVWQRVEWNLNRDDVTVDGANLFTCNRDWWKFRNNFPYKIKIVEEELSSGGSRANPGMFGRVVIDILCREGAEFRPEPVSVEPSPEPDEARPNPLAIYPDDLLAAELARRQATTAAMLKDADLLAELARRDIKLFDKDRFYEAMKTALERLFPDSDGRVPDGEQELAGKLHRFVGLTRLALEGKDE